MGYFQNGEEADDYHRTYCARCVHRKHVNGHRTYCKVWGMHKEMLSEKNKDDTNPWDRTYKDVMNDLIPVSDGRNLECTMFIPVTPKEEDPGEKIAYLNRRLHRRLDEIVELAEDFRRQFEREAVEHQKCKDELYECRNFVSKIRESLHRPVDDDLGL